MTAAAPLATTHGVRFAVLLGVMLVLGCLPCTTEAPLLLPDGGAAVCVRSTDCPRPADVLLCASTEDQLRGCIGCAASACVRYTPRSCQ